LEVCRPGPMLQRASRLEGDRHELPAPHAGLDQLSYRRLALGVLMTDRIDTDEPLRAQPALEQIVDELALRGRPRPLFPAEMAIHQLVALEHPRARVDGDEPPIEGHLQRTL